MFCSSSYIPWHNLCDSEVSLSRFRDTFCAKVKFPCHDSVTQFVRWWRFPVTIPWHDLCESEVSLSRFRDTFSAKVMFPYHDSVTQFVRKRSFPVTISWHNLCERGLPSVCLWVAHNPRAEPMLVTLSTRHSIALRPINGTSPPLSAWSTWRPIPNIKILEKAV